MKPVFKCDCCQNCKYSRKEQYNISNGFKNLDTSYGSLFVRVGLLSADLYRKYRDYIPSYNDWVWLCTPWYCSGGEGGVRVVGPDGALSDSCVCSANGVVPAVIFKEQE